MFGGYGVSDASRGWGAYDGIDMRGKVVVVLANDPDFEAGRDLAWLIGITGVVIPLSAIAVATDRKRERRAAVDFAGTRHKQALVRDSRWPAPEIALLALLEVLFGVAWAWVGAGERPPASVLFGGALVLGALAANEAFALRRKEST
mgnify:CR=1 FL=1